jgi:hypothetical protein
VYTPFRLTNCFFDHSQSTAIYTVVRNVITMTDTSTYAIGHLDNTGCPAVLQYASNTFMATSIYHETLRLTRTDTMMPTRAIRGSVAPVTTKITWSAGFGQTNANGQSVFCSSTGIRPRSTPRISDSAAFYRTRSMAGPTMRVLTRAITGSDVFVETRSFVGSSASSMTGCVGPSAAWISTRSMGSSDPPEATQGTAAGAASRSPIPATNPLPTVPDAPVPLKQSYSQTRTASEDIALGGGVIAIIATVFLILIIGLALCIFCVFVRRRRDSKDSTAIHDAKQVTPDRRSSHRGSADALRSGRLMVPDHA